MRKIFTIAMMLSLSTMVYCKFPKIPGVKVDLENGTVNVNKDEIKTEVNKEVDKAIDTVATEVNKNLEENKIPIKVEVKDEPKKIENTTHNIVYKKAKIVEKPIVKQEEDVVIIQDIMESDSIIINKQKDNSKIIIISAFVVLIVFIVGIYIILGKKRKIKKENNMKKLVLLFCLLAGLTSYAKCGGLTIGNENSFVFGIKDLTMATYYDFKQEELFVGGMTDVIVWKKMFSTNFGLITPITDKRIFTFGIGANLYEICKRLELDYKLANPLTIGYFYGKDLGTKTVYSGIFAGAVFKF